MAPTKKNGEEALSQIDKAALALTANPSSLAGTKRSRADDDDDDKGARTKRQRIDDDVDGNARAIFTSTNINIKIGRASDNLPQPSLSSLAPQTSISGPINPTPHHDGHEANQEKPLIDLQPSSKLTCRNEDLAGRILWAGNEAVRNMPLSPFDKKRLPPHPALIMSPKVEEDGTVKFLVLTSFQDNTLMQRFPGNSDDAKKMRSYFLPIEGAKETEPHPDDPVKNFMVKTTKNPYNQKATSYVNTTTERTVRFELLQAYKDGDRGFSEDYSIDETSFHKLEDLMKNRPPPTPEDIKAYRKNMTLKSKKSNAKK